ncbi:hypothetical protein DAT606_1542 [Melissococcus plutonius]|uniref:Uncharacterized protein n=1 Tax=Melissococcus plutonius TaxID=33970 RepID=A0A2Z5Y4A2_9ENTE|nr:hypothetical protein DAT561_1455 [Melissococcus plutonius]BBD14795.1 hypothetical protein DAT585_0396 [Melissococcus plutonius]BBD17432.1 hypothetical protein DAT606_1542 [Melissococcus plutonius]BBP07988.1 hypothetical protein DAT1033_1542 [Melissococcus plutonius]
MFMIILLKITKKIENNRNFFIIIAFTTIYSILIICLL